MGQTANIGCPMLGLFGEEDVNPTPEDVAKNKGSATGKYLKPLLKAPAKA